MSCNPYSLSKQLVVAAGIVRDACVRAPKYISASQGNDARASFLTVLRHALYDRFKRNGAPEILHNDGATIERAIDDDGLPASRAVPWLPIPRGLGHVVGENSDLPQILRRPHDNSGRAFGSRPGARISSSRAAMIGARPSERRHYPPGVFVIPTGISDTPPRSDRYASERH